MTVSTFFTPKNRKAIIHLIILLIAATLIKSTFSSFPYYRWNLYTILTCISAFYIHSLLLLPILIKKRRPKNYMLWSLACLIIFIIAILWFEAVRSSTITMHFDGTPSNPYDFFLKKKWMIQGFVFLLVAFVPFALASFMYSVLILDKKDRSEFLTLKYVELVVNIMIVGSIAILIALNSSTTDITLHNLKIFIIFSLGFYLNAYLITPVLIKKRNYLTYFGLIVLISVLFFIFTLLVIKPNADNYYSAFSESFNVLLPTLFVLLVTSFVYGYVLIKIKAKEALFKLRLSSKESELNLLKSQVNPHFLFNTLNTLYATALEEKATQTAESTAKLANLLRYMQNDIHKDFIPLENEIRYLEDYISIQKHRCEVLPVIETGFKNIDGKIISPGLLIPFVENAFKFGVNPSRPSKLSLFVSCNDKNIIFECTNSYDDHFKTYFKESGFGIGIKNAKQRLELVYPKNHILKITKDNNMFSVKLTITTKEV